MIKKESVDKLQRVIDKKKSLMQLSHQVKSQAQGVNLFFPEPALGHGYIQWELPPGKWIPFAKADDTQKNLVKVAYNERKELLRQKLGDEIAEKLMTFPDGSFGYAEFMSLQFINCGQNGIGVLLLAHSSQSAL